MARRKDFIKNLLAGLTSWSQQRDQSTWSKPRLVLTEGCCHHGAVKTRAVQGTFWSSLIQELFNREDFF